MKTYRKSLLTVLTLIIASTVALVYAGSGRSALARFLTADPPLKDPIPVLKDLLTVHADLVQDKVLKGSDGQISVSLRLNAADNPRTDHQPIEHADLVIVLDRSGSMAGQKLDDARQAVVQLIDRMTDKDRLALVTYSNGVQTLSPLTAMHEENRTHLKTVVAQITADGGTNLGGGLKSGIETMLQTPANGRQRRVILISDGLANQGITDPRQLGSMASGAPEHNFAVSTVGVGYDFNEILMTSLADHGAGRYYFLEDPNRFTQVFDKEFQDACNVAASGVEIVIPLEKGVRLVNSGGYPIDIKDGQAVVHPGDILSGRQRTLFLTFQVPTDQEREFSLGEFKVRFNHDGVEHDITTRQKMVLACVTDQKEVIAGIDPTVWSAHVVQEDFSRLKEEVAEAVKNGEKDKAINQIKEYETRTGTINASVGSAVVAENLRAALPGLRQSVEQTFAGTPAAVAEKKMQNSKALQYESYQVRRDKK